MSSWFSKKRNIAVTVGAAVLAVAVIGLIIYGVTTHSEPGLLRVCWNPNGSAGYVNTADIEGIEVIGGYCEEPEEITWPRKQLPLDVGWGALREGDDRGVEAAIRDINLQLGFDLLRETPEGEESDILIELEVHVPGHPNAPAGWAAHERSPELHCEVKIRSLAVTDRMVYLIAHHELLHCAGLAHDPDNPASAIYPLTRDDTMEDSMGAARITDFDRALLRRLYND